MIFAAGLGTRLKPLTDTMPKALVPVDGKPLLEHVARKLMASGVDEVVINVHHFADQIEEWIAGQDWLCTEPADKGPGMMLMQVSDERACLLETGGAVLHARRYLEGCGRYLIHNVDIFSNCDFEWLSSQMRPDAVATLLVSERKTSRYFLFDPDTMRVAGWKNVSTGACVMADPEIDPDSCRALAFSGIHMHSDGIFDLLAQYVEERGLASEAAAPRFSIVDFYLWAASRASLYGAFAEDLRLLDIGKLDALAPAEEFIRQL